MKDKKDLDFSDILKRTLHSILEDEKTRKIIEQALEKALLEYVKKTGYGI